MVPGLDQYRLWIGNIVVLLSLRLYSTAKGALEELRMASTLASDNAEMVHAGVNPLSKTLAGLPGHARRVSTR